MSLSFTSEQDATAREALAVEGLTFSVATNRRPQVPAEGGEGGGERDKVVEVTVGAESGPSIAWRGGDTSHIKKLKSLFKDCPTAHMKREEQAEVVYVHYFLWEILISYN